MGIAFRQLDKLHVSQDVLDKFDCGHPDFNYFLQEDAIMCAANGEGVTYVLVDEEEKAGEISVIMAFATIKSNPLYYKKDDRLLSESCVEIKYFAIAKSFQKVMCGKNGVEKYYSTMFFEYLLMDLYEMSTKVIGFTGIFCGQMKMV